MGPSCWALLNRILLVSGVLAPTFYRGVPIALPRLQRMRMAMLAHHPMRSLLQLKAGRFPFRQRLSWIGRTALRTCLTERSDTVPTDSVGARPIVLAALGGMAELQSPAAPTLASVMSNASGTANATLSVNDTTDHIINSTEAGNVSFTVSGLGSNETGAATFTDAANHQVVVNVGANGEFSADLSTLTDGTITSSLSVTDPAGHTATVSGNAVSLDTDSALNPSLTVNAANPANVIFTVSGLESDYSGTVTFTDSTGKSDVVPIGADGTYSANLSNLTNGTLTYLMTVSDPAGNVINVDPTVTLGDGSANAAAGPPEYASLLNGMAVRPPWMVAGVDYAVGTPAGQTLTDWEKISIPGVTVDIANRQVIVTSNNVNLNGIDFSLHGGACLWIEGASNVTVSNNKFGFTQKPTSYNIIGISDHATGTVIKYNTIDGAGLNAVSGDATSAITLNANGTLDVEYNWLKNINADAIQTDITVGNATSNGITFKYNLIDDDGAQAPGNDSHPDYLQFGAGTYNNIVVEYNTAYQHTTGSDGFWLLGGVINNFEMAYNTMVAVGAGSINGAFGVMTQPDNGLHGGIVNGPGSIHDNYVDPDQLYNGFAYGGPTAPSSRYGDYYNNVNMLTGYEGTAAQLINGDNTVWNTQPPTGGTGGGAGVPVITSFSTDSGVVGDHITNDNTLTLTGTAVANSTVNVYDGATLLGTATANGSGAWSFATGSLVEWHCIVSPRPIRCLAPPARRLRLLRHRRHGGADGAGD